jgi:hypothetical protein
MMHKIVKVSLLGLMLTGTAMANDSLAPIGTLQAGAHASIQNELGSFPVSDMYTVMAGDQIKIGESNSVATLVLDAGTLYVRPNSSLTLNKSNGTYTVALISGSIGYELDGEGGFNITSSGKEITPVATDSTRSGAVALGLNGGLVVIPVIGDARAVADGGIVTYIMQGDTWSDSEQAPKLTLAQVQQGGGMSTAAMVGIGVGVVAGGWVLYEVFKDDDKDSKSPSS